MEEVEVSIKALKLAIDSYEKLEEPRVATTSEILDRARMFRDFIQLASPNPRLRTLDDLCDCEQCRDMRATSERIPDLRTPATTMPNKPEVEYQQRIKAFYQGMRHLEDVNCMCEKCQPKKPD